MTDALFDLPKSQPKKRKPFVRTQRYTCKRCKESDNSGTYVYCHEFDICMECGSGERDGKMFTANGDERVVCDGVRCRVG